MSDFKFAYWVHPQFFIVQVKWEVPIFLEGVFTFNPFFVVFKLKKKNGPQYLLIWYDTIWYDMIWYDMIWYDMIWYKISKRLSKLSFLPMIRPHFFFFFLFLFFFFFACLFDCLFLFFFFDFVLFLFFSFFCFFFFSFYFFSPSLHLTKKKNGDGPLDFKKTEVSLKSNGPSPFFLFFLSFMVVLKVGRYYLLQTRAFAALVILLNWNSQLLKIRFSYSMFLKLLL